ncbi:MAG TPA: glycosyltransferase [Steroidobacteraceae bacterium]|jgi:glycosyltransferase involved in cell wall biosynthesis
MTSYRPGVLIMVSSLVAGGAEKHAISLANRLDPTRFRASLCHLKAAGGLTADLDAARLETVLCLDVTRKWDWRAVGELARQIDARQIDIVVCTNTYPLLYALVAARLAKRPIRIVEVYHTTGYRTPIQSRLRMMLDAFVFRQAALVVWVSNKQREYWRARGVRGARDVVIHNGIDTAWFTDRYSTAQKEAVRASFGFAPSDYVIGICAALRPEKQHGDLLQAMRRLHQAGVAAKLLIVGEGQQRSSIERGIAELQLQGSVAIAGYQSDVRPFIASCDVMVLTSHAVETFSLAALEAMSLGKPMVMTRIGGAEEQVVHGTNGLLFEAGDIGALAQHLQLLADPPGRAAMGEAAAQMVRERFTVQRMVARFTDELERLIPDERQGTSALHNRVTL